MELRPVAFFRPTPFLASLLLHSLPRLLIVAVLGAGRTGPNRISYDLKVAVGSWLADTRLLGMWPPDRDLLVSWQQTEGTMQIEGSIVYWRKS